ncbi:hypothetical protein EVAR_14899_1 [Eumeta japonica]|uniref:Uncharacterized protein n=1 Tax=Eumeta variegata TaxID=151549 RepID=A0A4C2AIE6_EUMVA|nr:hypothetical protein EVAR_14899_1 [Eumeta japonica]
MEPRNVSRNQLACKAEATLPSTRLSAPVACARRSIRWRLRRRLYSGYAPLLLGSAHESFAPISTFVGFKSELTAIITEVIDEISDFILR